MKFTRAILITVLCLSFVFAATACNSSPTSTPPAKTFTTSQQKLLQEVKVNSQKLTSITPIALGNSPTVQSWLGDINRLDKYLEAQLPKLQGKTLHVITQRHHDFTDKQVDPVTLTSQSNAGRTLEQINPNLLSLEGLYMDKFSKEAYVQEISRSSRELTDIFGSTLEPINIQTEADWLIANNAALAYAQQHPEHHAIGGEWRGLSMARNALTLIRQTEEIT